MQILQLKLLTHHLPDLRRFYLDILGLTLVEASADSITLAAGTTRLTFTTVRDGSEPWYHFAFNIPENQLAEAKVWISERTSLLADAHGDEFWSKHWNAHNIYFSDPVGNIGEFIARHDLDNASHAPFGPESMLEVSEMGLVVEDVPSFVGDLGRELGIEPHRGTSDDFTAVGDDQGMLIVVRRGRGWFPINKPAVPHPAKVVYSGPAGAEYSPEGVPYHVAAVAPTWDDKR